MSQENVKLVQRLIAVSRSGPPQETTEIALSLVDPALEFRSRITAVEGATYLGHEGVRRYFDDLADAFSDWRNEPDEIVAVGPDAVIAINTFHGVGRDSGMEVELQSAAVFVVSGGRVVRLLAYPTREEAMEAAGLSE